MLMLGPHGFHVSVARRLKLALVNLVSAPSFLGHRRRAFVVTPVRAAQV